MKLLLSIIIVAVVGCGAWAGENASATNGITDFKSILAKAKTGDADAEFQLGKSYCNGWGVKPNNAKAIKWFEKAGEQGIPEAQMFVGVKCRSAVVRSGVFVPNWDRKSG